MTGTVVNAGFTKALPRKPHCRRMYEWRNVAGVTINLPYSLFGTPEFSAEVRKAAPGPGWQLEGYALADAKAP